jgi:hypothetical protein
MVNPIDTTSGVNTSQFVQDYKTGDAAFDKGITQLSPAQQAKIGDSVTQSVTEMTTTTPPPSMPNLPTPSTTDYSTSTMSGDIDTANAAAIVTQMMNIFNAMSSKNMQSAIKNYAKSLDNALSQAAAQASLQKDQADKTYQASMLSADAQIASGAMSIVGGIATMSMAGLSMRETAKSIKAPSQKAIDKAAGTDEAYEEGTVSSDVRLQKASNYATMGQGISSASGGIGSMISGFMSQGAAKMQKAADLLGADITETAAQKDFENQMASVWLTTYNNIYSKVQDIMSKAQAIQQSIQESKRIKS